MPIIPFEPRLAAQIAALYNEAVAPVPDCHPVAPDRFARPYEHGNLRDQVMMVAQDAECEATGFVHVGISLPAAGNWLPPADLPVIRFLSYRPGERPVGQALLAWAEDWAGKSGGRTIIAWHHHYRYPFYHAPYCHLSEHMGHVRALFGVNGYREDQSELYLRWPDFAPPEPVKPDLQHVLHCGSHGNAGHGTETSRMAPSAGTASNGNSRHSIDFRLVTEKADGLFGPRLRIRALQGDRELGACLMDRGHWSAPNAAEWCFCDGLDVIDEFQGKRLGLFLLATGLQEMRKQGCRHAAITTGWTNHRAALMYTNLGFQHADRTYGFRKDLA